MKESCEKRVDKRGELSTAFIIGLVISIFGLVVILLVFYNIFWSGQIDDAVCHQSVVIRGTVTSFGNAKGYVPLKCTTQKICVGKECNEFAGVKSVDNAKVKSDLEIEKLLAGEMVGCWQMMGEGKLSLFSKGFAKSFPGGVYPSCVICSRVAFDENYLKEKEVSLDDVDVFDYMQSYKMPGRDVSYFAYLLGENGKFSIERSSVNLKEVSIDGEKKVVVSPGATINNETAPEIINQTQELAILFMQISAPSGTDVLKKDMQALGIVWGTAASFHPIKVLGATARAIVSPVTWALAAIGGVIQYGSVLHNQGVAASYCGDVSVGGETREGCSVVRLVDYNLTDISKYCSVIESIP